MAKVAKVAKIRHPLTGARARARVRVYVLGGEQLPPLPPPLAKTAFDLLKQAGGKVGGKAVSGMPLCHFATVSAAFSLIQLRNRSRPATLGSILSALLVAKSHRHPALPPIAPHRPYR